MIKITPLNRNSRTIHNLRNYIIKPDRAENFKIIDSFEEFGQNRMIIIEKANSESFIYNTNNYRKMWTTYFDMYD